MNLQSQDIGSGVKNLCPVIFAKQARGDFGRSHLPWLHIGTCQENMCRSLLLSERQQLGSQQFRLLFEFERMPVRPA